MAMSNLARVAEEAFERRGDYDALMFEGRWLSSAETFERSRRLAGGLIDLRVAILDAMPLTAVGKLGRNALRALVTAPAA